MAARGAIRLSGGSLRGRSVAVPAGVRPTAGKVREALFDMIGPPIVGSRFLDLFAGSGAVGLEALSRGAGFVLQVDGEQAVVRGLRRLHATLALEGIEVRSLLLPAALERLAAAGGFDWLFADPPYAFDGYGELVAGLSGLLAPQGVGIIEHDARRTLPESAAGVERCDRRSYGESALSFFRLATPG